MTDRPELGAIKLVFELDVVSTDFVAMDKRERVLRLKP